MQRAELNQLIATHGRNNSRAIVENFNWDADTYPKLESAYREAKKNFRCILVEVQVRTYCIHTYNIMQSDQV